MILLIALIRMRLSRHAALCVSVVYASALLAFDADAGLAAAAGERESVNLQASVHCPYAMSAESSTVVLFTLVLTLSSLLHVLSVAFVARRFGQSENINPSLQAQGIFNSAVQKLALTLSMSLVACLLSYISV